jgi:hypothetical protein
MKKASVYIETSIIGYLAARPSGDLMIAACQQITTQWWDISRESYDIVTSDLVVGRFVDLKVMPAQRSALLSKSWSLASMKNEILAEVWRNRDEFAKRCNYDLRRMAEELQKVGLDPRNPLIHPGRKTSSKKPRSTSRSRRS